MNRPSDGLSFLDQQLKLNTREDAAALASEIEQCPKLLFLELRGNTIGIQAGERIAEALEQHPELKYALWSDLFTGRLKNEIPPILRALGSSMIRAGTCLTELDLSDNAFGPIGAEGIQEFLCSPSAFELKTLRLNNNGLGAGGVIIANCLLTAHNNAAKAGKKFALKTFVAGRNRLEDPGAKALANAFKAIGTLEEITVPQNGIRKDGIEALAGCLRFNKNLRVINFNDNTCTRNGALAISMSLADLTQLQVLDLGDCLCRANGTTAILSVLVSKPFLQLKEVNLSGNELPYDVIHSVLCAWSNRPTQTKLRIANNGFGSDFEDLAEEIEERSLTDLVDLGEQSDDEGTADEESEADNDDNDEEDCEESDEERMSRQGSDEREEMGAGDPLAANMAALYMQQQQPQQPVVAAASAPVPAPATVPTPAAAPVLAKTMGTYSPADGRLSFLDKQLKLNTRDDAAALASEIEQCPRLVFLELRGNTIGIQAGERIAEALEQHPELKYALWSDLFTGRLKNEIPPILRALGSSMIRAGTCLTELDLSDNAFGPIGAEGIQEFLCSPSAFELKTLRLNNNGLGAGGVIIANCLLTAHSNAAAAGKKFALKTFIAGRNRLEDPGAKALAKAFKAIGSLEEITVPQNGIRKDGIEALASCLRFNKNLRIINFNDNTCTRNGALAISRSLGDLTQLEVLDLGDSLCRATGTTAILDVLVRKPFLKLKEVNLSGNELPFDVVKNILGAWSKRPTQTKLRISNNGFGSEFEGLAEEIQERALTELIDMGEQSDDEGTADEESEADNDDEHSDEEAGGDVGQDATSDGELYSNDSEDDDEDEDEDYDDEDEEEEDLERNNDSAKENSGPPVLMPQQQLPPLSLSAFCAAPSAGGVRVLAAAGKERLVKMIEPFASARDQTESARLFLTIVAVVSADASVEKEAVEIVDTLVCSVASYQRKPIPTIVQLMNHVVAHVDQNMKREENLVDLAAIDRGTLERVLRVLVQRGRLTEAKTMMAHYFPSVGAAFTAAPFTFPPPSTPTSAARPTFAFSFGGTPSNQTNTPTMPKFSFGGK